MPHALRGLASRILLLACAACATASAQEPTFTHADTLRGSITPERAWWDVAFYDLHVTARSGRQHRPRLERHHLPGDGPLARDADRPPDAARGRQHRAGRPPAHLPARRQRVLRDARRQAAEGRDARPSPSTTTAGRPSPRGRPWDGGLIWARDPDGGTWISTACQGLGASVWWPTKDTQADEPDSQRVAITVPDSLQVVANGRLRGVERPGDGWATYEWFVASPINNYDVAPYVGHYAQFTDTYRGRGAARSRSTSGRSRRTSRPPASSGSR